MVEIPHRLQRPADADGAAGAVFLRTVNAVTLRLSTDRQRQDTDRQTDRLQQLTLLRMPVTTNDSVLLVVGFQSCIKLTRGNRNDIRAFLQLS